MPCEVCTAFDATDAVTLTGMLTSVPSAAAVCARRDAVQRVMQCHKQPSRWRRYNPLCVQPLQVLAVVAKHVVKLVLAYQVQAEPFCLNLVGDRQFQTAPVNNTTT
jgi:hypothetical protein